MNKDKEYDIHIKLNFVHTVECSDCSYKEQWCSPMSATWGIMFGLVEHRMMSICTGKEHRVNATVYNKDTDEYVFDFLGEKSGR